jgi:hypothetical protein
MGSLVIHCKVKHFKIRYLFIDHYIVFRMKNMIHLMDLFIQQ